MRTRTVVVALSLLVASGMEVAAKPGPYRIVKAPAGKPYSHVIKLRIGPFDVGATQDREVCQFLELPYLKGLTSCLRERPDGPESCGLPIVGYDFRIGGGASHHFILWAYEGTSEGAAQFPEGVHDSKACLDLGPADSLRTRQIGGSQTRRLRQLLPDGLGQRIRAFTDTDGRPRGIGLVLNSHYIGNGEPARGVVRVRLFVARSDAIRAYGKLVFDVFANALIDVEPGKVQTTSARWEVGGPEIPLGGPMPRGDACVLFLSAHMHKRGVRFTTDLVDTQGSRRLYEATDYEHPGVLTFRPPLLMKPGMQFRYECTHDNGATTPVKRGCELEPGEAPGAPIWLTGRIDGAARGCATDADCTGFGTGRCVPANLVFGFTSDDEMCILPGMYYDAVPGAPPGHECDVSLLPPR